MRRRWGAGLLTLAFVVLAACAGDGGAGEGGTADDDLATGAPPSVAADERTTVTAAELAPSQVTASTVARPATPPPCDLDDLDWWTAQVAQVGSSGTATLRVRNAGAEWCEVDIGSSPGVTLDVEPNVWLEPGEWADLLVGSSGTGCPARIVREVELVLGGTDPFTVPTGMVVECGPTFAAFYVAESPSGPCTMLDAVVTDVALLVRNDDFRSCRLGELVGATGVEIGEAPEPSSVDITELAGGDVVAFDLGAPTVTDCPDETTALEFAVAGEVVVPGLGGCSSVALGPGRPWFGGTGPLSSVDDQDVESAPAALDPFG